MARLKSSEMDKFFNETITAFWLQSIWLVQYPESQLNFICFSFNELHKEIKKTDIKSTPNVYRFSTYNKPTLTKLPIKAVKNLLK